MTITSAVTTLFDNVLEIFLVLSPMLLMGLLIAGLMVILVRQQLIVRWLGGQGLRSVISASAFGAPLPLCSCGVVPVTVALRKKGAGKPAAMSFLISTPESGADSILVSLVLLGPLMAVVRPVVSFFTAVFAGIMVIACLRDEDKSPSVAGHDGDTGQPHHHHNYQLDDRDYVGLRGIGGSLIEAIHRLFVRTGRWQPLGGWYRPSEMVPDTKLLWSAKESRYPPLSQIVGTVFQRGFVELLDEISLNLLIGVVLAGVILTFIPDTWVQTVSDAGFVSLLLMLLVALPMYMCATTSTPIAAALLIKGISPGAALVFLLAGPATNISTLLILRKLFGSSFVQIYVVTIIAMTLLAAVTLDWVLKLLGVSVEPSLDSDESLLIDSLEWFCAVILFGLISWRMVIQYPPRRLLRTVWQRFVTYGRGSRGKAIAIRHYLFQRWVVVALSLVLCLYLGSGFYRVPPGSTGFALLFGQVVQRDLQPGLHYFPPWPIGRFDRWSTSFPRRVVVGLNQAWLTPLASVDHLSVGATKTQVKDVIEYLSGDENLIDVAIVVLYHITDPYRYFYKVDQPQISIALSVRAAAREYIAQHKLLGLFSVYRLGLEQAILRELEHYSVDYTSLRSGEQPRSETASLGIVIQAVSVTDVHPLQETISAFRQVTDAEEQRETAILKAEKLFTMMIPRAIGNAELERSRAEAQAWGIRLKAEAERDAFLARAEVVSSQRDVLQHLLWLEVNERVMQHREIYILPGGYKTGRLAIWQRSNSGWSSTVTSESGKTQKEKHDE